MQNRSENQALSPLLCLLITASATFNIPSAWAETHIAEFSAVGDFSEEEMSFSSASIEIDIDKERFQNTQNLLLTASPEADDSEQVPPTTLEEFEPPPEEDEQNEVPVDEESPGFGETTVPGIDLESPAEIPVPPGEEPSPQPETPETTPAQTSPAEEPRVLVGEVVVIGADEQLTTLIYNTINTKPGRTANRSQLQADVNAIYATGYFSNVNVPPADTPLGVRVTFEVTQNPIFREIVIENVPETEDGAILPQEEIDAIFEEQYGRILNLRELQTGITKINEWYAEKGFDLAQIIGAPNVSEDGIVRLVIAEGIIEKVAVRFFDNEDEPVDGITRDFIVTREMQLKPGDVFNRFIAQTDLQRLFGLGLFEDVRLSFSPGSEPQEVIVNVDIVEGNTGSISAGGGFSSTAGIFGTISYQQQNLGGNNQTIGGELQIGERELLFDVSFTDPWIAGDPFRTSYSVSGFRRRSISLVYDGEDTSIRTAEGITLTSDGFTTIPGSSPRVVRTGGSISFSRPIADSVFSRPQWRLSTGINYQNIRVENSDGDLRGISSAVVNNQGQFFPAQQLAFNQGGVDDLLTVNFIATQDYRDNPLQPTQGHLLRLGVEQTLPLSSSHGIVFNRLRGSYSFYIPVNWLNFDSFFEIFGVEAEEDQPKAQALAFNFQAGTVLGDLPPYEAFILGGSNSVRGFAEGEVGNGRSFVQATAEYRFPLLSAVGIALFFDYGSTIGSDDAVIGTPSLVRGLPGWGFGYGAGVRIQSPVGAIRVDFGVNNDGDSRIHFGIGERF